MSDLYLDFTSENNVPAYGKDAISRSKFNKWLLSYASYKSHLELTTARDMIGKWMSLTPKKIGDGI